MNTIEFVADYLQQYINIYREEYRRLISPSPYGRGLRDIMASPFLDASELDCALCDDGYVIWDGWECVDNTRRSLTSLMSRKLAGYEESVESEINLRYEMGTPIEWHEARRLRVPPSVDYAVRNLGNTILAVYRYHASVAGIVGWLTHNAVHSVGDNYNGQHIWTPHICRYSEFGHPESASRNVFRHLEWSHNFDELAWDPRAIWARAHLDVTRLYANSVDNPGTHGGFAYTSLSPGAPMLPDRLNKLEMAIEGFESLLGYQPDAPESVFHDYLIANPILLDAYGDPVNKPRWRYPDGGTVSGKAHVEPDIVMKYRNFKYRLIELERPSKLLVTNQGHPRSEVTQTTSQIAEWKLYIDRHYAEIEKDFPGIAGNYTGTVIIGRETSLSAGKSGDPQYIRDMLNRQFQCEVLTYEDVIAEARAALLRLSSL
jgi:hypothetical protein